MKLLFSEGTPDYTNYIFPYVIWAFPEKDEEINRIFEAGFLPSSRLMQRFYMARQVRVALSNFSPNSENRRVMRKCADIQSELLSRDKFHYTPERRLSFKTYADRKFGRDVMSFERLDELFASTIVTHVLQFTMPSGEDAGSVALFLYRDRLAFYYYAFYNLKYFERNLGMYMMTSAVKFFAEKGYHHVYLGTCYSEKALYKTQFPGAEFFNGVCWSPNLDELKFVLRRDTAQKHLLEDPEFMEKFYNANTAALAEKFGIKRD
jgi:arginyl-tRNA--protein-N-Asp/Glu arginylyltransferase